MKKMGSGMKGLNHYCFDKTVFLFLLKSLKLTSKWASNN